MKRFITSLVISIYCLCVYSQSVYCVIDINTVNSKVNYNKCIPLNEECGHVIIPNSFYKHNGSSGLLVFHDAFSNNYYAYDLKCPECNENNVSGKIYMETCILCKCKKCNSQFLQVSNGSSCQTNHNGDKELIRYNVYRKGHKILITDRIITNLLF